MGADATTETEAATKPAGTIATSSPGSWQLHAGYDLAADIKYPSDTLRSPTLAARANLIVAIPSSTIR